MIGVIIPEDDKQETWEKIGRMNALHDLMMYAPPVGGMMQKEIIAAIMGFADLVKDPTA